MKRLVSAIALIALFVTAAPAAAKPKTLYYDGKTVAGNSVSFAIQGKRIFAVKGYVTSTCVPTHGTPRVSADEFNPPGSFALGRTRKASKTEFISYRGDVTKNYEVDLTKVKGRVWTAKLHVNYSYEEVTFGTFGELVQTFYVCQGDDAFKFIV
jgi:hypothetical protein